MIHTLPALNLKLKGALLHHVYGVKPSLSHFGFFLPQRLFSPLVHFHFIFLPSSILRLLGLHYARPVQRPVGDLAPSVLGHRTACSL